MSFAENFLQFIGKSQFLKSTTRHSWTSNKRRQESTAEHTWHLGLMAMTLAPHLKNKIDLLKTLKMITVHDLGEALTGDIAAFKKLHANKDKNEEQALREICITLDTLSKNEIHALWKEYSEKKTTEARFVKTLDIIDVLFQHLLADISTWTKKEYSFNTWHFHTYFNNEEEPILSEIYKLIQKRLIAKLKQEGRKEWQKFITQ